MLQHSSGQFYQPGRLLKPVSSRYILKPAGHSHLHQLRTQRCCPTGIDHLFHLPRRQSTRCHQSIMYPHIDLSTGRQT